jgi:membrane protein
VTRGEGEPEGLDRRYFERIPICRGVLKVFRLITIAWLLLKTTCTDWLKDNATSQGAALAFYAVISLAPLLVIAMAMASAVFGEKGAAGQIVHQTRSLGGHEGAAVVKSVIQGIKGRGLGAGTGLIGIGTLLLGAMGVFVELQDALNKIWRVKPKSGSLFAGQLRKRLLSFVLVLGVVFLLVVTLASSAGLTAVAKFVSDLIPASSFLSPTSGALLSFGIAALLLAMIFKLLPDTHVAWADVWVGAVLTALFFTIGKVLMGSYMGKSDMVLAYGAAGSFITLLVWIYYSAQILLLGAEFSHVYATQYGSRAGRRQAAVPPR